MTAASLVALATTPAPLYPDAAGQGSPVPLWLGIAFAVLVVVTSVAVLLPGVRRRLDRISSRRPRRFQD